uniref:class I SAM-dependent methyltransferase n=1 Tax=Acetatifactor sp. TaxID=1872090 RepID=UPI0040575EE8
MVQSKGWNWKNAEKDRWMNPSEDSVYLARKWASEGARSILDLGCGLGRHALFFAEKGFKVTAVDLSEDAVKFTKENMKEKQMDFACQVADMMKLPFADDAFDRVFSYHVISHQDTAGVQKVIDEITRVLKPGGKVFLSICSKKHFAFSEDKFARVDENTVLKTEGAEVDVPHFFADKKILNRLFHDYKFDQVRHITECVMEEDDSKERSHFFIEATVQKEALDGRLER